MAFVTGTANDMAGLLTALRNACTSNGWTLSGNVLHKGTCYVRNQIVQCPEYTAGIGQRPYLVVRSGNGIDGGNELTDPAGNEPSIGPFSSPVRNDGPVDWDWPVNYFIHISAAPDEVRLVVGYNAVFYQHLWFGQTPGIGNPGTGNWHFATMSPLAATNSNWQYKRRDSVGVNQTGQQISTTNGPYTVPQPFWITSTANSTYMNYAYHGMRGDTGAAAWAQDTGFTNSMLGTAIWPALQGLIQYQPNAWNNQVALLPMQLLIARPDFKTTLQAEFMHARKLRIDFIDPESVITLGPDRWKVYPCLHKDISQPTGGVVDMHSGAFGVAIRYDGP